MDEAHREIAATMVVKIGLSIVGAVFALNIIRWIVASRAAVSYSQQIDANLSAAAVNIGCVVASYAVGLIYLMVAHGGKRRHD